MTVKEMTRGNGVRERVTGALKFTGDLHFRDLLHGKFVRLPCAHARIKGIAMQKALQVPGVVHIFSPQDFEGPMPRFGPVSMDQPIFAVEMTRFSGEAVALVVAENQKAAKEAAAAVKVDYEELPPILTVEEALNEEVRPIHEPESRPQSRWKDTNIMGVWDLKWGDVAGMESGCAFVADNVYQAPFVHHFAMETSSVISVPEPEGITIHTPIQNPFLLQQVLANMLGLPASKVRVKSIDMGGAFGSKGYAKIEPAAALFSRILKKPLKISLSAEESFLVAQREAAWIHIRTGFDSNGIIVFQDVDARFLVGAYEDISAKAISKCCYHATGPYRTPNARIKACGLFSTTPPTTAYRGFGNTHTGMALEGQLNIAAAELNLDPVEIRLRNLARRGEVIIPNERAADGDWPSLVTKAAQAVGWDKEKKHGVGRGLAFGMKASKPATVSNARVILHYDCSATAFIGTTEMGQGTRAVMAKVIGDSLDIPPDRISIYLGDTARVPFDTLTAASRSVVSMGNALVAACDNILDQLRKTVASEYGLGVQSFRLKEGEITTVDGGELSVEDILRKPASNKVGEIVGNGSFRGLKSADNPLGGPAPFYEAVVTAVELEVDLETGRVDIYKIVHVSDVGKAINAQRSTGVDEGGNIMGLGLALSEQIHYGSSGQLLNGSSLDYRIPTILDAPGELVSIFQENRDGPGPQGSKGLGEGGVLAVAPAVCAALFDATGIVFREIPITPEKIWRALQQKNEQKGAVK